MDNAVEAGFAPIRAFVDSVHKGLLGSDPEVLTKAREIATQRGNTSLCESLATFTRLVEQEAAASLSDATFVPFRTYMTPVRATTGHITFPFGCYLDGTGVVALLVFALRAMRVSRAKERQRQTKKRAPPSADAHRAPSEWNSDSDSDSGLDHAVVDSGSDSSSEGSTRPGRKKKKQTLETVPPPAVQSTAREGNVAQCTQEPTSEQGKQVPCERPAQPPSSESLKLEDHSIIAMIRYAEHGALIRNDETAGMQLTHANVFTVPPAQGDCRIVRDGIPVIRTPLASADEMMFDVDVNVVVMSSVVVSFRRASQEVLTSGGNALPVFVAPTLSDIAFKDVMQNVAAVLIAQFQAKPIELPGLRSIISYLEEVEPTPATQREHELGLQHLYERQEEAKCIPSFLETTLVRWFARGARKSGVVFIPVYCGSHYILIVLDLVGKGLLRFSVIDRLGPSDSAHAFAEVLNDTFTSSGVRVMADTVFTFQAPHVVAVKTQFDGIHCGLWVARNAALYYDWRARNRDSLTGPTFESDALRVMSANGFRAVRIAVSRFSVGRSTPSVEAAQQKRIVEFRASIVTEIERFGPVYASQHNRQPAQPRTEGE